MSDLKNLTPNELLLNYGNCLASGYMQDAESFEIEICRRLTEPDARLWAIAHKLGIEKEELPGQLAAQIVDEVGKLQEAIPMTNSLADVLKDLQLLLDEYDCCFCDDDPEPIVDSRLRCTHCMVESAIARLQEGIPTEAARRIMSEEPRGQWPDPTLEMLETPEFNAIWNCIKTWDINVPEQYGGYCGATGNHVRAILDALAAMRAEKEHKDV